MFCQFAPNLPDVHQTCPKLVQIEPSVANTSAKFGPNPTNLPNIDQSLSNILATLANFGSHWPSKGLMGNARPEARADQPDVNVRIGTILEIGRKTKLCAISESCLKAAFPRILEATHAEFGKIRGNPK